jgi:fatty-acyl-CoA synthase
MCGVRFRGGFRFREFSNFMLAPAFLRLQNDCDITGTFKYSKSELIRQGYNPHLTSNAIYFNNPETQALHLLDEGLYESIQAGRIRL